MKTIHSPDFQSELVIYRDDDSTRLQEETPLPVDREMLDLIEAITGWVVEFEESRGSHLKRNRAIRNQAVANRTQTGQRSSIEIPLPEGQLLITDMSAEWPAGRPTSHRGKCDRFVRLLSELVFSRQQLELDSQRTRAALASLQSQIKSLKSCDDEIVVDTFVPQHPYHTCSELIPEFELNEMALLAADESLFGIGMAGETESGQLNAGRAQLDSQTQSDEAVNQSADVVPSALSTKCSSSENEIEQTSKQGCRIGGCRGFYGNRYVDWRIREDQRIELILGQIETLDRHEESSDNSEWESKLILNPETNKYWLSVKPKGDFWLYDQQSQTMEQIESSEAIWHLKPAQAIVLTTTMRIRTASRSGERFQHISSAAKQGPDRLAQSIQQWLQTDEPVLVLGP